MREIKFRGKIEGNWWYVRISDEHMSGSWEQFWSLVDKKTVGEYTSLKDAKNKEIYEGDICSIENDFHLSYEVYWNDDRWGLRNGDEDYNNGDYYHGDDISWNECEVIGNLSDNPKLMRK